MSCECKVLGYRSLTRVLPTCSALDAKQRVEPEVFEGDLRMLRDVWRLYVDMRSFTNSYLGDFEESSFAKVTTRGLTSGHPSGSAFWRKCWKYILGSAQVRL